MIKLTKFVLKRPVTAILCILSLVFFGFMSLFNSKLELTPEINMPMLVISTTYPGASPSDIDELITRPIEDNLGSLSNVDSITSSSSENYSMVLVQYEYGTDMDNAYSDLRKKLDRVRNDLPEDASDPTVIVMDINSMASIYLAVNNPAVDNIYNYTDKNVVPELEKMSSVASVDISGGQKEYVSVCLIPEKLAQYHLDISTVAQIVGSASFTIPSGSAKVGSTDMNMSTGVDYDSPEALNKVPITLGNGNIIYLEDIAVISRANEKQTAIGRYNGQDTIILGVNRNTQYTAVDVSNQTMKALNRLKASDPNLDFVVIDDSADQVRNSIKTMIETMISVIILSTVVLFIFYGDVKASLIVATSIPISILTAFVLMWARGYSFNLITLGAIVLGVGMMVDNSIVILEACFRAKEENPGIEFIDFIHAAVGGTGEVAASVLGSTITTCVVFLPLGMISGLSGQFFQPLGFTIVFCMIASLLSSCTIVPLCYTFYKPKEKEKAPAYKAIRDMQKGYRSVMQRIMQHKKRTLAVTAGLLVISIIATTGLKMELMPSIDQGTVQINIDMRSDLTVEKQDETYKKIENIIAEDSDVESYLLSSGGSMMSSGTTLTVYLKKNRKMTTDEHVAEWKEALQVVDNCDISVESYSQTSMMSGGSSDFSVTLVSADYDKLKEASDNIYKSLQQDNRVTAVSSTLANTSPIIKIHIDPVQAAAEGFVPAQVAGNLYTMLSGKEADTMRVDGTEMSIMVEYPEDEFDTINKVEDIMLTSNTGNQAYVKDIADVSFEDSPGSIARSDKHYNVDISASYTDLADKTTKKDLRTKYVEPNLSQDVEEKISVHDEMMGEEFKSLGTAIAVAIFLVFVVMAAQFESARFSFMVMATIPFAMIGALGFLWLFNIELSMTSLMGFLILVGTAVNNGILYVDTVDQKRQEMRLDDALIEAGVIRLRPILMTTITTIIGMLPMAIGFGESSEMMQGLAMVDVGGLITSTIMALLVLPVLYYYVNGNRDRKRIEID